MAGQSRCIPTYAEVQETQRQKLHLICLYLVESSGKIKIKRAGLWGCAEEGLFWHRRRLKALVKRRMQSALWWRGYEHGRNNLLACLNSREAWYHLAGICLCMQLTSDAVMNKLSHGCRNWHLCAAVCYQRGNRVLFLGITILKEAKCSEMRQWKYTEEQTWPIQDQSNSSPT